jgi:hypothetical protein
MKIFEEKPLTSFEWWGNAKDNVCELTREEMDTLEFHLEDLYPDGIDATTLNDIVSFDFDWVKELLGKDDDSDEDDD